MTTRRMPVAGESPFVQQADHYPRADPPAPPFRVNWTAAAVAVSILAQAALAISWGSSVNTRVGELEKQTAALSTVPATLARLDERSEAQGSQLAQLVARDSRPPRR